MKICIGYIYVMVKKNKIYNNIFKNSYNVKKWMINKFENFVKKIHNF